MSNDSLPRSQHKWESLLNKTLDWEQIYLKPFLTTKDTKLRWFQYRISHKILTTNSFLYKIKLRSNDLCTFCLLEPESIVHLFCECEKVKTFWNSLMRWLKDKCSHIYDLSLDQEFILFGCRNNVYTDKVFDLIILFAKYFIYRCKVKNISLNLIHFKSELHLRYNIEKAIHFGQSTQNKFYSMWMLYHCIFENN